jgi:hypothetical protein
MYWRRPRCGNDCRACLIIDQIRLFPATGRKADFLSIEKNDSHYRREGERTGRKRMNKWEAYNQPFTETCGIIRLKRWAEGYDGKESKTIKAADPFLFEG